MEEADLLFVTQNGQSTSVSNASLLLTLHRASALGSNFIICLEFRHISLAPELLPKPGTLSPLDWVIAAAPKHLAAFCITALP